MKAGTATSCVPLSWMLRQLVDRVTSGVAMVFLDACRENAADRVFKARGGAAAGTVVAGLRDPSSDSVSSERKGRQVGRGSVVTVLPVQWV